VISHPAHRTHPLQIAVMAKEYRDKGQFPLLPTVVQRALIAPLAAIGVRVGYRALACGDLSGRWYVAAAWDRDRPSASNRSETAAPAALAFRIGVHSARISMRCGIGSKPHQAIGRAAWWLSR